MRPGDKFIGYKRSRHTLTMLFRENKTKDVRVVVYKSGNVVLNETIKNFKNKTQLSKTKQIIKEQSTITVSDIKFIPVLSFGEDKLHLQFIAKDSNELDKALAYGRDRLGSILEEYVESKMGNKIFTYDYTAKDKAGITLAANKFDLNKMFIDVLN